MIFDLDGCLIDSSVVQKKAFIGSYKEVVGDDNCPPYSEYIKHTGDSVDNVMKKMGLPEEMAVSFREISSNLIDEVSINWEAIEWIQKLRKQGCRIAICTGKDRDRTQDILAYYGIEQLFDVLVCADDVNEPKPSPEPILRVIKELDTVQDKVLFIGDGYNDILSSKNANVKSVLTLWFGDNGVPRDADYVVDSVKQLEQIINEITSSN